MAEIETGGNPVDSTLERIFSPDFT
ncbi:hypothetical protein A2U01_0053834, partial [Trifolium medium]|nr:hypothetical protein [Trifolium medium]